MRPKSCVRTAGCALALAGALMTAPLSASASQLFDGGGYGPTAEYAVQAAMWDAEANANASGFYTCELAGEPTVFPQAPGSRRAFRAQVMLRCEA